MSLATIPNGAWIGCIPSSLLPAISAASFIINASGKMVALIIQCPKTGTIDRFSFYVGTVTDSPDNGLRASIQSVSVTTGLPSGTVLGATNNAFVTYAHPVSTGWKNTNFGETVSVSRGDIIALVVDVPSFTAGDSVTLLRVTQGSPGSAFPYGVSGTSTKETNQLPFVALHYTDGYVASTPNLPSASAVAQWLYSVTTGTADEYGIRFQLPVPSTLDKVAISYQAPASADAEVVLYDSNGSTVLGTISLDADVDPAIRAIHILSLPSQVNLLANTTYRVTLRPTTSNTIQLNYFSLPHTDLLAAFVDSNWMGTSQLNQGGTWTDYNTIVPVIGLNFSAFDDGASSGGAMPVIGSAIVRGVGRVV